MSNQWPGAEPPPPAYPPAATGEGAQAGFWRRLGALIVDLLLVWIASNIIAFVITVPSRMDGAGRNNVSLLVQLVVSAIYFGYLWSTRGQSVGYMAFGIRVVKTGGGALSLGAAVVRGVAVIISFYLCLVPALISAGLVGFGGRQQALHDLLTDTHVVRG